MSSKTASRQQKQQKKQKKHDASYLLNFHTPTHKTSKKISNGKSKKKIPKKQESWEEKQARKSDMFFLHSAAHFSFILTRRKLSSDAIISTKSNCHNYKGPDVAVRWDAVRMVKCLIPMQKNDFNQTAVTNLLDTMAICPICLEEFIVPRITKCGHAFCLPCILRHFQHNSKCPCCYESIHTDQLRPILFHTVQPPQTNIIMSFTRLHRVRNSYAPYLPLLNHFKRVDPFSIPSAQDQDSKFSRFNYVDTTFLLQYLRNDRSILLQSLKSISNDQIPYTEMAIQFININEQKAIKEAEDEFNISTDVYKSLNPISTFQMEPFTLSKKQTKVQKCVYLDQDSLHFYQASDGQLCFLSKTNMDCLSAEYTTHCPSQSIETYQNNSHTLLPLPDIIQGQVIETKTLHLTPECRKRINFLSHLPLYTDIQFVEINLHRYLSEETKTKFKNQIEQKRKIRKHKKNIQKKTDRAIQKKEQQRIDALKATYTSIDPDDDFFHTQPIPLESSLKSPPIMDAHYPSIHSSSQISNVSSSVSNTPKKSTLNFRNACEQTNRKQNVIQNFPPLSVPTPSQQSFTKKHQQISTKTSNTQWGPVTTLSSTNKYEIDSSTSNFKNLHLTHDPKIRKSKQKKISLFSTGGHCRYNY